MVNKAIDWENMNNASIKMQLEELNHQQNSIKDKIIDLSKRLEEVEKNYLYGNKILTKRYKGE
jgi:predicted  nucleic acid-binding Zn-ribbon protein